MSSHDAQPAHQALATIETAIDFGLDPQEVCDAIADAGHSVRAGADGEQALEMLSAALAGRILERERGALAGRR